MTRLVLVVVGVVWCAAMIGTLAQSLGLMVATSRPAQETTFVASEAGAGPALARVSQPFPAAVNVTASVGNVPSTSMPGPASTHTIRGTSSWYCGGGSPCTFGHSPSELIAAIDPTTGIEKGERVTVWHGDRSVTALVIDVCACPGDRIVDLSRAAFSRLADPSVGLIRVVLVPARGAPDAPAFTLPPTSTED